MKYLWKAVFVQKERQVLRLECGWHVGGAGREEVCEAERKSEGGAGSDEFKEGSRKEQEDSENISLCSGDVMTRPDSD